MTKKEEKNYYQLCCDIMNIVEKNYKKEEVKEAYDFAMSETKKIDAKDEKEVRWSKSKDLSSGKIKKVKILETRHY